MTRFHGEEALGAKSIDADAFGNIEVTITPHSLITHGEAAKLMKDNPEALSVKLYVLIDGRSRLVATYWRHMTRGL